MSIAQELSRVLAKFDEAAGTEGGLTLEPFTELMVVKLDKLLDDEDEAKLFFRGIDVDGSGTVNRREFASFIMNVLKKDHIYLIKLLFRAYDKDRSKTLDSKELKGMCKFLKLKKSEKDIEKAIEKATGKKSGALKFSQVVKVLIDKDIPSDRDPYDGILDITKVMARFDELDTKKNGTVTIAGFKKLFDMLDPDDLRNEPTVAAAFFRGIDIDGNGTVTKEEFEKFVRAIVDDNTAHLVKLGFCAVDTDRGGKLGLRELEALAYYFKREWDKETAEKEMEQKTGSKTGPMTYAQAVDVLCAIDIPADSDPYDGHRTEVIERFHQRVKVLMDKFDAADTKKTKKLDLTQFKKLLEGMSSVSASAAPVFFRGIDVDGGGAVDRKEFEGFAKGLMSCDQVYLIKLLFRASDKDRSGTLDKKEVKALATYLGSPVAEDDIERFIERKTGKKDGTLTYAQIVDVFTGVDLPKGSDPYDGKKTAAKPAAAGAKQPAAKKGTEKKTEEKPAEQSACCLLI